MCIICFDMYVLVCVCVFRDLIYVSYVCFDMCILNCLFSWQEALGRSSQCESRFFKRVQDLPGGALARILSYMK